MIEHLPTNTEVEIELADGTKLTDLRTNGNNFVSDTPIEDSVFEGNLSVVKLTTPDGVTEYKDLKLVQNRQFGDVYMFVLAEKTAAEKEKEELLQLLADIAELTLEAVSNG
jgi:hypothetical protein